MFYSLSLLLTRSPLIGSLILVSSLLTGTILSVEESEHLLFSFISIIIIILVWPLLESGINLWISGGVILISCFFWCSSPLLLYSLFEISLLPVVILILGWGTQIERISASLHLIVYTFLFSSPLLICVIFLEGGNYRVGGELLSLFISIAFIVNTPLYFVHAWLPNAHVEAPTSGSIILAAILLNIGGVGFIWSLTYCNCEYNLLFFFCALLGSLLASITCSFQSDLKALIAYSSIAHINYSTLVIIFISSWGDSSSSLLILSHSLVSSILFITAGICFHNLSSRLIYFLQSSFIMNELLFLSFLCTTLGNFSTPPLLSLIGEIPSFSLGLSIFWSISIPFSLYFLLVAYYSLFLSLSLTSNISSLTTNDSLNSVSLITSLSLCDFILLSLY